MHLKVILPSINSYSLPLESYPSIFYSRKGTITTKNIIFLGILWSVKDDFIQDFP